MKAHLGRWVLSLAAVSLFVIGCSASSDADVREIFVTGVELKGTTSTESLSVPDVDPTTLSLGYRYKAPGFDEANPANWQVATYVWTPGTITAFEGDEITLTVFIVNGDHHSTRLIAPDGTQVGATDDYQRGRETKVQFTATQAGTYQFLCDTHAPTMSADILILPR